jgi:hypothetical protein
MSNLSRYYVTVHKKDYNKYCLQKGYRLLTTCAIYFRNTYSNEEVNMK